MFSRDLPKVDELGTHHAGRQRPEPPLLGMADGGDPVPDPHGSRIPELQDGQAGRRALNPYQGKIQRDGERLDSGFYFAREVVLRIAVDLRRLHKDKQILKRLTRLRPHHHMGIGEDPAVRRDNRAGARAAALPSGLVSDQQHHAGGVVLVDLPRTQRVDDSGPERTEKEKRACRQQEENPCPLSHWI